MTIKEIINLKIRSRKEKNVEDWVNYRRKICGKCPLNSKHNKDYTSFRWWKWHILNIFEDFCTSCGCEIKAKTLAEVESCPINSWSEKI